MNVRPPGPTPFAPSALPDDAPEPLPSVRANRHGLQARLLRYVTAGAMLGALVTAGIAWSVAHDRAADRVRTSLSELVRAVQKTAAIGAFARDNILMQEVVEGIARQSYVARVSIVGPDGKDVVHAQRVTAPAAAPRHASPVTANLPSPFDAKESLGTLRVDMDMDEINASANQDALVFALAMALQSALIAALVYVLASRFVSRPITQLAGMLARLKAGTARRVPTPPRHAHDEIGALIAGTNLLLSANEEALGRERTLRAEVEQIEAQYRKIFDTSSAGIFVLDGAGRLINSNPAALRLCDIAPQAGPAPQDHFVERAFRNPDLVHELIERATHQASTASSDLQIRRAGGGDVWVHCLISVQEAGVDASGLRTTRIVEGVMYDITERKHAESAALHQALHDGLTGLKNRVGTVAAIDQMLSESMMLSVPMSVLFIDLDGFKRINDTHGHEVGDQVLLTVAARLRQIVRRNTDLIGRIGGDEFVVALHGVGSDSAELIRVGSEIVHALCQSIEISVDARAAIGASVGIACYPRHGVERKPLLDAADIAMYEVKRHGKNAFAMALPLTAQAQAEVDARDGVAAPGHAAGDAAARLQAPFAPPVAPAPDARRHAVAGG